jgi:hypothetical protein
MELDLSNQLSILFETSQQKSISIPNNRINILFYVRSITVFDNWSEVSASKCFHSWTQSFMREFGTFCDWRMFQRLNLYVRSCRPSSLKWFIRRNLEIQVWILNEDHSSLNRRSRIVSLRYFCVLFAMWPGAQSWLKHKLMVGKHCFTKNPSRLTQECDLHTFVYKCLLLMLQKRVAFFQLLTHQPRPFLR